MTEERLKDLSELARLFPGAVGADDGTAADPPGPATPLPRLVVRIEKKGRRGKQVTVVTGLEDPVDGLQTLARELKSRCGAGGTVRDGTIEVQGDHREAVADFFQQRGHRVARG